MNPISVNVLTPPRLGGPFTWAKNLVQLLNQKNIRSKHIFQRRNLLFSPIYQDADIIHTAFPQFFKLYRKPIVFTLHGDYTIEKSQWIYPTKLAIRKANALTTPSYYLKDKLHLDDAIVIPNAVYPDYYNIVNHRKNDQIHIVSVTNFAFRDKAEGIIRTIKFIDELKKLTDITINYTIVGDGKYLDHVKTTTQDIRVTPHFTGFLKDIRPILENGDIFIYYSIHDNFPISLLEAMASGLPIVTNNVGAVPEIITDSYDGYVCADDEKYKECLLKLIENTQLRENIGLNARCTVEEKFNWVSRIYQYISIYNEVLH
ncbi:MAG: glycosyltransferase family 4 protein [Methanoregula sp.]